MTRDTTAATTEQRLREADEQPSATQGEAAPDEEPDTTSDTDHDGAAGGTAATESHTVSLNGEPVSIRQDTTVGELRESEGVGSEAVFTYRSPDGIEALTDDDVVADYVDDGGEIQTQPMGDSEVFGAR